MWWWIILPFPPCLWLSLWSGVCPGPHSCVRYDADSWRGLHIIFSDLFNSLVHWGDLHTHHPPHPIWSLTSCWQGVNSKSAAGTELQLFHCHTSTLACMWSRLAGVRDHCQALGRDSHCDNACWKLSSDIHCGICDQGLWKSLLKVL